MLLTCVILGVVASSFVAYAEVTADGASRESSSLKSEDEPESRGLEPSAMVESETLEDIPEPARAKRRIQVLPNSDHCVRSIPGKMAKWVQTTFATDTYALNIQPFEREGVARGIAIAEKCTCCKPGNFSYSSINGPISFRENVFENKPQELLHAEDALNSRNCLDEFMDFCFSKAPLCVTQCVPPESLFADNEFDDSISRDSIRRFALIQDQRLTYFNHCMAAISIIRYSAAGERNFCCARRKLPCDRVKDGLFTEPVQELVDDLKNLRIKYVTLGWGN